ncbi:MAG: ribosome biogenesis GTPase Der [Candidatus Uhrbacteria bacterium]
MFTAALIGRTNVGKSSLFNKMIGESKALISPLPHTTRDRNVGTATWRGIDVRIIDSGGVDTVDGRQSTACPDLPNVGGDSKRPQCKTIETEIRRQVDRAVADADILLFVIDARDGLLPGERKISRDLHRLGKPVIVVYNKAETATLRATITECAALGFNAAFPTSAATGMGIGDLLDAIVDLRQEAGGVRTNGTPLDSTPISPLTSQVSRLVTRIAIIGEPNVGKSSLINAILGHEEVIVLPEPFTTRDVHDVEFDFNGTPVVLLDTAGIRRRAVRAVRTHRTRLDSVERLAVERGLRAIEHAHVACLVLDATRSASRHVKQLAAAIVAAKRACIIVVNKIDLIDNFDPELFGSSIHQLFPHLSWAPVLATSAITGTETDKIVPLALRATDAWRRELCPNDLAAIHAAVKNSIPTARSADGRRRSRIIEIKQTDTTPPTFLLLTRRRVKLPQAIPAIAERVIRSHLDFIGTPLRIVVKSIKA